jgi:NADPH2:quinone reductase
MGYFEKVIVVCGSGRPYLESFGVVTDFVDYRNGNVVHDLKAALGDRKCFHAVDAINDGDSFQHLSEVLAPEGARMAVYLPRLDYSCIPASISVGITFFGTVHGQATPISNEVFEEDVDFAYVFFRLVGRWIVEGKMSGHPFEILPHGLQSVEDGLRMLKEGNVSAKKLIYKVADTPCIKSESSGY